MKVLSTSFTRTSVSSISWTFFGERVALARSFFTGDFLATTVVLRARPDLVRLTAKGEAIKYSYQCMRETPFRPNGDSKGLGGAYAGRARRLFLRTRRLHDDVGPSDRSARFNRVYVSYLVRPMQDRPRLHSQRTYLSFACASWCNLWNVKRRNEIANGVSSAANVTTPP